ncbi:type ISP restriction/modification enzyme [Aerosakkonema funiforme]|uniref:type ISP restriction/modification enzyme n=1 Tax=Aerosakkonema funiforme TaxID=1246630 RepID=UPI0035BB153B
MNSLETYLHNLGDIRSSGAAVKETSYYGALESLFNDIGKTLKPKVRCIISLKNQGAGLPDGGLFTANQFQRVSDAAPFDSQNPERGVIEVKGTKEDVWEISKTEQVSKYWQKYRQVLVTNYRDFLLIGQDENGKAIELESYRLASSETDFWAKAANPRQFAQQEGDRFLEYLKRVMLSAAPIAAPADLAWFLASYARDAKFRIENTDIPALANVRTALEEALGVKFEGEKGDRFFRSTLVQTLFYSIFSAWVLWHKENPNRQDKFDWRTAAYYLHVPMIQALFYQISDPRKLKALGLVEVLEWTGTALNRVKQEEFFAKFEEGQAVQYFYEPFLQAFDPELRKELGVWYTPNEVVKYMVTRVDTVLREELGIEDGLADPNVYILDPCCGTGAYLVEVLKQIAETLKDKGEDALGSYDVKEAAIKRVFGFEILTAPFVVAHLQLGLLLQNLGVPLVDEKERVGVYLTNALTGWEPPDEDAKKQIKQLEFNFPELKQERDAADEVKREKPILVILGNPPYNAFAGVSPKEEQGLVETYKEGLISEWGIKKFNLDDLYIRFLRLAEQRIAEKTNKGVVCYISNFSYLGDPSFVVMRQRFLSEFDKLWFDCMNGDSRETGKLTPEGKPDPSVFSTEYNREGIRVGTAIALLVRQENSTDKPLVRFRHFWGVNKRIDLLASLNYQNFDAEYELAKPDRNNRYSFRPSNVSSHYLEWPKLVDLCAEPPSNGLFEKRGGALIDIDKNTLEKRMQMYYDVAIDWETLKLLGTGLTEDAAGFEAKKVRAKVQAAEDFQPNKICRYGIRAFETRWCYYSDVSPLWNRSRPSLWAQCWEGNVFLISRPAGVANPEGVPLFFTPIIGDNDFLRGHAYYFPLRLRPTSKKSSKNQPKQENLFDVDAILNTTPTANLSGATRTYLSQLGITNPDADANTAGLIWMHALAIGYSPAYLTGNADGIRDNWPRIPLPNSKTLLLESAELGKKIAALLDTENPIIGVTSGKIRLELKAIAIISRTGGGQLNPDTGDLAITAGWGYSGQNNVTMPGKGKIITRPYTPEEIAGIEEGAKAQGLSSEIALNLLGKNTCDIYLNEVAFWKNIPINVWEYTIGGYQVIKKWLSYREEKLLGRSLTKDEVREVMNMARRIAVILLLQSSLDDNYQNIKQASYKWK